MWTVADGVPFGVTNKNISTLVRPDLLDPFFQNEVADAKWGVVITVIIFIEAAIESLLIYFLFILNIVLFTIATTLFV